MLLRGALDDATTRYLGEIAADLLPLLGGIELSELSLELTGPDVILRARYGMGGETMESVGRGATSVEAHAALRRAIVGDRIGLGLRVLI